MRRLFVTIIATTAGLLLFGQLLQAKPIIIGAATDTQILDGFATVRGLRLAIEEINASGGVKIGSEKRPFKLEVMDTRDCDTGVPVSEALLVVEKVILDKGADFIIGPSRSEAALASLSLISRYKKVYLSTCGGLSRSSTPRLPRTTTSTNTLSGLPGNRATWSRKLSIC